MDPDVSRGLELTVTYRYWFVSSDRCTGDCEILVTGGPWSGGGDGNSLYFLLNV